VQDVESEDFFDPTRNSRICHSQVKQVVSHDMQIYFQNSMLDLYLPSDSALLLRRSMVFQKTVVIQSVVSMGVG
jgi:hypothetical protein